MRRVLLFFLLSFFTGVSFVSPQETLHLPNIIITNFIDESGYSGDWDLENEIPGLITEAIVRKYQEIPVWRKRSWRDNAEDVQRKFPGFFIITGRITSFGYMDNSAVFWPFAYTSIKASVEIQLEIISGGKIYTEICTGEEGKDEFKFQLYAPEEQKEKDDLAGVKFGDAAFWNSLPGRAVQKAIDECMRKIEQHFPEE